MTLTGGRNLKPGKLSQGLTVAETVLAIGLLAIAGLALLAVFTRLLSSQSATSYHEVAQYFASTVLQTAVHQGPPLWGMSDLSKEETALLYVQDSDHPAPFRYKVIPVLLKAAPASSPMGDLYLVKVQVSWSPPNSTATSVGMGTSTLTLERAVYIER